ncbi:hypothetical protein EJ06DRAFT_59904 [Trichodelitschia bisporula]|uniref:Uncharacterized protein n=1 Tax=Trichodelitschia bisporula TaxID=703511 RepID=A0A6G1HUU0_9PEZI|nr:hypothetical protein EJ06DRAFT_59904 [Trichodelitschia bisporula]
MCLEILTSVLWLAAAWPASPSLCSLAISASVAATAIRCALVRRKIRFIGDSLPPQPRRRVGRWAFVPTAEAAHCTLQGLHERSRDGRQTAGQIIAVARVRGIHNRSTIAAGRCAGEPGNDPASVRGYILSTGAHDAAPSFDPGTKTINIEISDHRRGRHKVG